VIPPDIYVFLLFAAATARGVNAMTFTAGWVERSDTHQRIQSASFRMSHRSNFRSAFALRAIRP
jgi:hypothetical protein